MGLWYGEIEVLIDNEVGSPTTTPISSCAQNGSSVFWFFLYFKLMLGQNPTYSSTNYQSCWKKNISELYHNIDSRSYIDKTPSGKTQFTVLYGYKFI